MRMRNLAVLAALVCLAGCTPVQPRPKPNVLVILADQWRAQALGYAGDPNVKTPHLDRLETQSVNFVNAVSTVPVCSPYRGTFLTGRQAVHHGVFMNDVQLPEKEISIAEVLGAAGYDTACIGKWHVDGHGRTSFIPRERRQGFRYWKVLECTHNYNKSPYYDDTPEQKQWDGYDAVAQTEDAVRYIRERAQEGRPFFLFLSWGPPHAPYLTAPEKYRKMYDAERIELRPNVPEGMKADARRDHAGYYAHCTALDDMAALLMKTLEESGIADDTIVVFTSDHGDLLGSHGFYKKQQPYDESIRVPMLFRYPALLGKRGRRTDAMIHSEDIMPTILGLCGAEIPEAVEGLDFTPHMRGGPDPSGGAALISCVQPFGQWNRSQHGGREYRGIRTPRYTYARGLHAPWLLFDNEKDPHQLHNLVEKPEAAGLLRELDGILTQKLKDAGDKFLPGPTYLEQWGYKVDETGTVPYRHKNPAPEPAKKRRDLVSAGKFFKIYDPSVGEEKQWYINDHCFVRHDGTWHLFGITHAEPMAPLDEKNFAHATAKTLAQNPWKKEPFALTADWEKHREAHLWAPHVIRPDGRYWMFYCAGAKDHAKYRINLANSDDLWKWTRHPGNPMVVDGYDARDPFLLRVGDEWVMYYTATSEPKGGNHQVAYRTSRDLVNWSERKVAFTDPKTGTYGGPCESPFVVRRGPWYYLFIGPRGGYVGTNVYRSRDPFSWTPDDLAGYVRSHAAEVIRDVDGTWYVSHCGWKQGGVYLARLVWNDGEDENDTSLPPPR